MKSPKKYSHILVKDVTDVPLFLPSCQEFCACRKACGPYRWRGAAIAPLDTLRPRNTPLKLARIIHARVQ